MRGPRHYLIIFLFFAGFAAFADPLFQRHELGGPEGVTRSDTVVVDAPPGTKVGIVCNVVVRRGLLSLTPVDAPAGLELPEFSFDQGEITRPSTFSNTMAVEIPPEGLKFEIDRKNFTGEWLVSIAKMPGRALVRNLIPSGLLMTAVAIAFLLYWRFKARPRWRWFALGAGLWIVGVAMKFAVAIPSNEPILGALNLHTPVWAYLALGSLYIGLLTGIFEIGPVWLAAWIRPGMTLTPARAIAVGVGAGVFEALLLGLWSAFQGVLLSFIMPLNDQLLAQLGFMLEATPVVMFVGPVERISAILCHIASRTLALYGVAVRRSSYAWLGFWLLTLLDGVAGYAYLTGYIGGHNLWWVEVALLPFAVSSVWITLRCVRQWPTVAPVSETDPSERLEIVDSENGAYLM